MKEKDPTEFAFEDALKELENTVSKLEGGELPLEEALELFEKGQLLASYCSKQLETASMRVEMLTSDGEIVDLSSE
jgi:exodeoxyribonuclease VII small subunit